LSAWLLSVRSATRCLSRRFSSSSWRSRGASETSSPPYLAFHPIVSLLEDAVLAAQFPGWSCPPPHFSRTTFWGAGHGVHLKKKLPQRSSAKSLLPCLTCLTHDATKTNAPNHRGNPVAGRIMPEEKRPFQSHLSCRSGRLYGPGSIVVHTFGGRGSPTMDCPFGR